MWLQPFDFKNPTLACFLFQELSRGARSLLVSWLSKGLPMLIGGSNCGDLSPAPVDYFNWFLDLWSLLLLHRLLLNDSICNQITSLDSLVHHGETLVMITFGPPGTIPLSHHPSCSRVCTVSVSYHNPRELGHWPLLEEAGRGNIQRINVIEEWVRNQACLEKVRY